jgi:YHS domain-containing protein
VIRVKDPVCGREFDLGDARAHEDYRGWAYFFCSDRCHGRFVAHPDRFVGEEQRQGEEWLARSKGRGSIHP